LYAAHHKGDDLDENGGRRQSVHDPAALLQSTADAMMTKEQSAIAQ
jgi:hypothetical protein